MILRRELYLALSFVFGVAPGFAQTNPPKLANQARFDLIVTPNVGAITHGFMLAGDASIARQTRIDAPNQPRSYWSTSASFTLHGLRGSFNSLPPATAPSR